VLTSSGNAGLASIKMGVNGELRKDGCIRQRSPRRSYPLQNEPRVVKADLMVMTIILEHGDDCLIRSSALRLSNLLYV
jgi:hypothetical protein